MIAAAGPDWFARTLAVVALVIAVFNFALGRRDAGRSRRARGLEGLRVDLRALLDGLEVPESPAMVSMLMSSLRNTASVESVADRTPGCPDRQLRRMLTRVPALLEACRGSQPTLNEAYEADRPRANVNHLDRAQRQARSVVRDAISRIDKLERKAP